MNTLYTTICNEEKKGWDMGAGYGEDGFFFFMLNSFPQHDESNWASDVVDQSIVGR